LALRGITRRWAASVMAQAPDRLVDDKTKRAPLQLTHAGPACYTSLYSSYNLHISLLDCNHNPGVINIISIINLRKRHIFRTKLGEGALGEHELYSTSSLVG